MLNELIERYPMLEAIRDDIAKAADMMYETYEKGGKILLCGNGGSCADCDHIVGELMKGFLQMRPLDESKLEKFADRDKFKQLQGGIPAISLPSQSALLTAFINDVDPELMYAQLTYGYARKNDLLIGLSTSGNSKNVVNAVIAAKAAGIKTLAPTGSKDSKLSELCDCTIKAPGTETYKIQELHLPIYHYLCADIERRIFG